MKPSPVKPILSSKRGDEIPISGEALLGLMREVLSKGAMFHFRAKGWSMAPFIRDGDAITIAPRSQEKPAVGKVVAYIQATSGRLVVHRVIAKKGPAFLVQGDNAAGEGDELVYEQDILGCVISVERDGRRVFLGLGVERYLVANLSRHGWLDPVVRRLRYFKRKLLP